MHKITRFAFWTGGLLLPPLHRFCLQVLLPAVGEVHVDVQTALLDKERALWQEHLDPAAFCRDAVQLTGSSVTTDELKRQLQQQVMLAFDDLPDLLVHLSPAFELYLASDYPRQWLFLALERTGLSRFFPPDRVCVLAEHDTGATYPELFTFLVAAEVIIPGSTLWVDHNSRRTTAALRAGIDAAIFVDVPRLRRDLALWGLV